MLGIGIPTGRIEFQGWAVSRLTTERPYSNGIWNSQEIRSLCILEVVWLRQGASSNYKTITNFHKDNNLALQAGQQDVYDESDQSGILARSHRFWDDSF